MLDGICYCFHLFWCANGDADEGVVEADIGVAVAGADGDLILGEMVDELGGLIF